MPQTSKSKNAAPRSRHRFNKRKNQKGKGCKGSHRNETCGPAIIANSLFALTLKPKFGYEVMQKTATRSELHTEEDPVKMYKDLLGAVTRAQRLLKIEGTEMDPLASGLDLGAAMFIVINRFKENILPKDNYQYNIDFDGDDYFFTVYKELEFPWAWHTFEIKLIAEKLKKRNEQLHDVFFKVMKALIVKIGMVTWWDGALGYAEHMMEFPEEILNQFDFDEEDAEYKAKEKELKDLKHCYTKGDAHQYKKLIHRLPISTPDKLEKMLSRFKGNNSVLKWLKEAVEFIKQPGSLSDFIYEEFERDQEGIQLDRQVAVVWDYDDYCTEMEMEAMDSDAQHLGVFPPILNFPVGKTNRFIDIKNLKQREQWPMALSRLQSHFITMREKVKRW